MRLRLSWIIGIALTSLCVLTLPACDPVGPFSFLNDNDNEAVNDNDNASDVGDNANGSDAGNTNSADPDNANTGGDADPTGAVDGDVDSDGDGFSDEEETTSFPGSDPNNPNDTPDNPIDTDGDGCSDFDETNFVGFCDGNPNTGGDDPLDSTAAFTFNMTVARHTDLVVSEAEVDAKLVAAATVLRLVETECPDVATDTAFVRTGSLGTFDAGGASVTTEAQLDDVFAVDQDVKVVEFMVGVCGVPADDMTVVLGCASAGGTLVIVATAPADVWAHEWGHVQGLTHRDECPRNVMHSFELETNAVNEFERTAFLNETPTGFAKVVAPAEMDWQPLARTEGESMQAWLTRLATGRYLAGIPAPALAEVGLMSASLLEEMLWLPEFAGSQGNIARMIGYSGEGRACSSMIACPTRMAGELSFDQLAAVAESILAVGRLSKHDDSGVALQWLIEGTSAEAWSARGVNWSYASLQGRSAAELSARLSVMALGLTDSPAALAHLRTLAENSIVAAEVKEAIARLDGTWQAKMAQPSLRLLRQP